jgi:hypothetical protein
MHGSEYGGTVKNNNEQQAQREFAVGRKITRNSEITSACLAPESLIA